MPLRHEDNDVPTRATSLRLKSTMRSWLDLLRLESSQRCAHDDDVDDAAELPLCMKYVSAKHESGSSDSWKDAARGDFEDIRFIARGSFGKVSLVRHKETKRMLALKEMAGVPGDAEKIKMLGLKEADIMKSIRHPFIVSLQHVFLDDFSVSLAMEFVPGEDLWSLIYEKNQAPIPESKAIIYLAQIAIALEYLHEKGIVYCDLKSENIIVDVRGNVRLVDFGCAQRLQAGAICTAKCGTIQCLAPEAISVYYEDGGYSFPVDYWALGVLAYEMIVGTAPFTFEPSKESPKKFAERISTESGDLLLPSSISESAGHLLRGLLNPDPCLRLGKEVRECKFFAGIDFNNLTRKCPSFSKRVPSESALSSKI